MNQPITRITARNFRSLEDVDVALGPLTVLVGPNGSGKSNVLNVLRFLASTVQYDLVSALEQWGGYSHVRRQDGARGQVVLGVAGQVTGHSSVSAPDEYELKFSERASGLVRSEVFTFKRSAGRGRRLTVEGRTVNVSDYAITSPDEAEILTSSQLATGQTTGLATLPKLGEDEGGAGIRQFTEFLTGIRVLEPDVASARQPSRDLGSPLADDAGNLADALQRLRKLSPSAWDSLLWDVSQCLPGLTDIVFQPVGGARRAVAVQLVERGLTAAIDLVDASFGTVRLLALLAALHDPKPAPFIAIEEVDHGLHPYALDLLVDRLRAASKRTQILAATHSPTLLNRLRPEEIVVCDRDAETGASVIPAVSPDAIARAMAASELRAGELWFAGAIRGVPDDVRSGKSSTCGSSPSYQRFAQRARAVS